MMVQTLALLVSIAALVVVHVFAATPDDYNCPGWVCGVGRAQQCSNTVNVSDWAKYPWYDCSSITKQDLSVVSALPRTRKEVTTLTDEEKEILMIALSCSRQIDEGGKKSNYMDNSVDYLVTFHGQPGWFPACQDSRQGNAAGTCCVHHLPTFWTWHRLYITQFENSLLQWNQSAFMPYFGWVNYENYASLQLPDLLREQSFTVGSTTYRNPFYLYSVSQYALHHWFEKTQWKTGEPQTFCNYSLVDGSLAFYESTHPTNWYSLYNQIYNSMFYKSFVAMDLPGELPHDNVHDTLFGNMPNLDQSSFAPIFLTHHSAVEKYFLVWQTLMKETFGIDYTQSEYQKKYFGCFLDPNSPLPMETYLAPFHNSSENADPVTNEYAGTGFDPMDWESQHYKYDNLNLSSVKTWDILQKELCIYFKDTTSQGCMQYSGLTATDSEFASLMYLGWYLRFDNYGMRFNYTVYRYNDSWDDLEYIFDGSFSMKSAGYDGWAKAGTRYLYKQDITSELEAEALHLKSDYFYIDFTVAVKIDQQNNDNSTIIYNTTDGYVSYPLLIYRDSLYHDSNEVYQWYVGERHNYVNNSVIFNPHTSLAERNHNMSVHIIELRDASSYSGDFSDTELAAEFGEVTTISVNNDFYAHLNETKFIVLYDYFASDSTDYIARSSNLSFVYYDPNTTEKRFLSYTSLNTVTYASKVKYSLNSFADQYSWQGFDGSIFIEPINLTNLKLTNEIDDILEEGQLNIPWVNQFISTDDTLYNHTHSLTGWTVQDSINFIACGANTCDSKAYVVYTKEDYDSCNMDSTARQNKPGFDSFSCASGWVFKEKTTYYFISTNETSCNLGLKLGIYFDTSTDCVNSVVTSVCTVPNEWTRTGIATGTDKNDDAYSYASSIVAIDGECTFDYILNGPMSNGWSAWAFWGPYTEDGEDDGVSDNMKGFAIVTFYCDKCVETMFVRSYLLKKEGSHSIITELDNECTVTADSDKLETHCTNIALSTNADYFQFLPEGLNFSAPAQEGKNYYGLYAQRLDDSCSNSFSDSSAHSSQPVFVEYTPELEIEEPSSTAETGGDDDEASEAPHICIIYISYIMLGLFAVNV